MRNHDPLASIFRDRTYVLSRACLGTISSKHPFFSRAGVNDDPQMNGACVAALQFATEAAGVLGETADPKWQELSKKLLIPYGIPTCYAMLCSLTIQGEPGRLLFTD